MSSSEFPGSPRLLKGAIIGLDPFNPLASVVVFQYNPETVTRSITPRYKAADGNRSAEALRLQGPPGETIQLTVEVDATDQLEDGNPLASALGVYPTLSALEMLVYPKSALVIANEVLAALGVIEVIPPQAPLTLLVWGPKRVLPVKLTSLSITEQAFDPRLNPIRAAVTLNLTVLTYQDLGLLSPGGALSMVHQVVKEVMATLGSAGAMATSVSAGGSFSLG